jgi:hypothetical protein
MHIHRIDTTNLREVIGWGVYAEWLEFDHLLVQLWESHGIRIVVKYEVSQDMVWEQAGECMMNLLPEATMRDVVDFVEQPGK